MFGKKSKELKPSFPFPKNGVRAVEVVDVVPVAVVESDSVEVEVVPERVESVQVVDAPKKNISDFFKAFTGKNVTSEQTTRELMVADENLDMKTEIRDPIAMSLWDTVGDYAEERGYELTSKTYRKLAVHIRKNMVSYDRGSRKELERILTADAERSRDEDVGAVERGFSAKGGRGAK